MQPIYAIGDILGQRDAVPKHGLDVRNGLAPPHKTADLDPRNSCVQHHGNQVNLDGGAGYGNTLHPAVFEGRNCWLVTPQGRQALRRKVGICPPPL